MHDDALNTDPELVDVAGNALLLAVENDRLQRELQLTNAELRSTRARIVSAGDSERRKIERDLHDGAQQHLVALRIRVGLATELADPVMARRLADVGIELEEIRRAPRPRARALPTPAPRLRPARRSRQRREAPAPPARVEDSGIGRFSDDTEAAVYFCCVESLQNVGKHAGVGANAVVRLWQDAGRLCFEIEDNCVGCDVESVSRSGAGYTNMADRIAAVGGELAVESRLGEGTTVRGSVPAGPPLHEKLRERRHKRGTHPRDGVTPDRTLSRSVSEPPSRHRPASRSATDRSGGRAERGGFDASPATEPTDHPLGTMPGVLHRPSLPRERRATPGWDVCHEAVDGVQRTRRRRDRDRPRSRAALLVPAP